MLSFYWFLAYPIAKHITAQAPAHGFLKHDSCKILLQIGTDAHFKARAQTLDLHCDNTELVCLLKHVLRLGLNIILD